MAIQNRITGTKTLRLRQFFPAIISRAIIVATANKNAPPPPDVFGIPDNGKGIGFGRPPPPALMIDVAALPKAPKPVAPQGE